MWFRIVQSVTGFNDGDLVHADQLPEAERLLKLGAIAPANEDGSPVNPPEVPKSDADRIAELEEEAKQAAEIMKSMQAEIEVLKAAVEMKDQRITELVAERDSLADQVTKPPKKK